MYMYTALRCKHRIQNMTRTHAWTSLCVQYTNRSMSMYHGMAMSHQQFTAQLMLDNKQNCGMVTN